MALNFPAEMVSKITDENPSGSERVAVSSTEPCISFCFYGLYPLQSPGRRRILSRAAYIVLGVTVEGYKDILSITVGANETTKFWLGMLNDLKEPWRAGCPVLLRGRAPRL